MDAITLVVNQNKGVLTSFWGSGWRIWLHFYTILVCGFWGPQKNRTPKNLKISFRKIGEISLRKIGEISLRKIGEHSLRKLGESSLRKIGERSLS